MLEKLKRRIPDAKDDALLGDLLAQAGAFVRSYTRRDVVPDELMDAQIEIAAGWAWRARAPTARAAFPARRRRCLTICAHG